MLNIKTTKPYYARLSTVVSNSNLKIIIIVLTSKGNSWYDCHIYHHPLTYRI